MSNYTHKNVFSVIAVQGITNSNHNEIPNASYQRQNISDVRNYENHNNDNFNQKKNCQHT